MRVVWVCLTVILAGCAGTPSAPEPDAEPMPDLPVHCDADRPAVAHGPGAEPREPEFLLYPCLSKTGAISREPTMGVDSDGTVYHYPAMTGDNTEPMGVAISKDRGDTWDHVLPDIAGEPFHRTSVDPYFYHDRWTDRIFADDLLTPNCSYFSWSDDGGASWDHSISGCMETDHQTIFSAPPVTSDPDGYANVVYRCAINAVALGAYGTISTCQKSLDGGLTWLPPGEPAFVTRTDRLPEYCSGAHGHGWGDDEGTIYLPKGHCGVPMLAISDDEGASWRQVAVADNGIQGHDGGVAVDDDGTIYYTWIAGDGLPHVAYSQDEGATWSDPIMYGPPGLEHARFAEVYVNDAGVFASSYMGTWQEADDPDRVYDGVLAVSYDLLGDATFYSQAINGPDDAFIVGGCCQGLQDFMDVVIGPDGTPWGAYIDDCLGPGMDCSTREIAPGVEEALDTQREGAVGWFTGGPGPPGDDGNSTAP